MARKKKPTKPTKPKPPENDMESWAGNPGQELSDIERAKFRIDVDKAKKKATEERKMHRALQGEIAEMEKRLNFVLSIEDSIKPVPIKPLARYGSRQVVPVFVASDWHVEERVDPDMINGLNEYNPNIAVARGEMFFQSILRIMDMFRSTLRIDKIVLALLGDMITGYIHEELEESNYLSPTEACLLASNLICGGIDLLLKKGNLKQIVIPCCYGNHGRTTKKTRVGTASKNSFEWFMYHMIKQRYENDNRVVFYISDGYHLYLDVYGVTIRFHHGDFINYGGGIGGITPNINKSIKAWNQARHADIDVMGHWHQMFDGGDFIVNGSLIGFNSYALKIKARPEPPRQTFFLIDPDRGKFMAGPVFVEKSGDK